MSRVNVNDIKVGERFRKEFEGIEDLAQSIKKYGLIEPIIIDEHNNLIAGERRYRAHQLLGLETIETKTITELSELEKKEIELEENIQRKAFTWQEEVDAKAQLHELKQKLHGASPSGSVSGDRTGWGMRDTARALDESVGNVSMDIQLAKGLALFPELIKEKSKSAAFKKLKSLQEKILQDEYARRLKIKGVIDNPDVKHGDCVEEMSKMEQGSIDLIVTDPPYGIDIDDAHTYGRMTDIDTRFNDGAFDTFNLLDKAFAQMYRILKPGSHCFVFIAIEFYTEVKKAMEKYGFWVHPMPLIWDKGSGSYPSQSTTFVHSYEAFIHATKGKGTKLNGTPRDVFPIKRVPGTSKIHPTEKPTELLRELINLTSKPGDKVFDPFAGSGATIVAARETSRLGCGCELDEVFYKNICTRLQKEI